MFKWLCFGVAVVFLSVALWMLNDIRLHVRQSAGTVHTTGATINQHLPDIVSRTETTTKLVAANLPQLMDKATKTADTISDNLPSVVDNLAKTSQTLAELSEDVQQLKELIGVKAGKRDEGLVAYANGLLQAIESSKGEIGTRKITGGGLKNKKPAAEWCVAARREALVLSILVTSRQEMLRRLAKTKLGADWYIELRSGETTKLLDWAKANHAESKKLDEK